MSFGLELIELGAETFGVDGERTGWRWAGGEGLREEIIVCLRSGWSIEFGRLRFIGCGCGCGWIGW